jgi:uncharacterized protein with FMN-binding domain
MNLKKRSLTQLIIVLFVLLSGLIYAFYLRGLIDFKLLSVGDLNPYGGWSELKSAFTDVAFRFRGISRSTALTLSILLTSLLFGRFFCGFICPLGALQDYFSFLGNHLKINKLIVNEKTNSRMLLIKYVVLISALGLSILNFGHLISSFSPWLAFLNIILGFKLSIGTGILVMIIMASLFIQRPFCRFLCPLGAFQSLMSALGPFKIKSNHNCNGCYHCLQLCPIDIKRPFDNGELSPECISCLNCVERRCIKNHSGYSLMIFNKKIEVNRYILLGLIVFLAIYLLLPIANLSPQTSYNYFQGLLIDGRYFGTGVGFGGPIQVSVWIENNKISKIDILSHRESSGYFEEVFMIKSKEIIEKQGLYLDAVSGATASSRGFYSAVRSAVSQSIQPLN